MLFTALSFQGGGGGVFDCFSSWYFSGTVVSLGCIVPGSCGECRDRIQIKLIRVHEGLRRHTHILIRSFSLSLPSFHRTAGVSQLARGASRLRRCSRLESFLFQVYTRYGKCYTFNGNKTTSRKTKQGGMGNGLEIMLDIQQDEYLPIWRETSKPHHSNPISGCSRRRLCQGCCRKRSNLHPEFCGSGTANTAAVSDSVVRGRFDVEWNIPGQSKAP